jgi:SSS family solute:Na+ symporter
MLAVTEGLGWLDYVVIIAYFATIVSMGLYFSKRQKSTDRYYTGGRSMPAWAVGMSILAALISSVTFLAYPGAGFSSNWILLVQGLMVPIVLIFLIWFVVPLYRKMIGISAYEFFEKRFGFFARLYGSIGFSAAHFIKMGTVFYLLALALATVTGYSTYTVILILGILVIFYTLLGGIEGVVWCEVIQGFLLMGGGLLCVAILLFKPEGGPVEVLSRAWNAKAEIAFPPHEVAKIGFGPFTWDFVHLTFVVIAINGIFYAMRKYGTDQTVIQRFLVAKSDKAAIKASLIGVLLCVPVWTLFMFIGTLLWSYYQITEIALPENLRNDQILPQFVATQLPMGVTGLILAALMAAALSSLDADLNCLSAVVVEDYYRRLKPESTDKQRLIFGKIIVVLCGIGGMVIASLYVVFSQKSALATIFKLYAIFSGGIAGLFVLGFLTTRANRKGTYIGIVACILFTAWAVFTSLNRPGTKIPLLNLGPLNYGHSKYMLEAYSVLVLLVVGYVASFFFKSEKDTRDMTYFGWRKTHKKVAEVVAEE